MKSIESSFHVEKQSKHAGERVAAQRVLEYSHFVFSVKFWKTRLDCERDQ